MTKAWYQMSSAEVVEALDSNEQDLSGDTVSQRLQDGGPNELSIRKKPARLRFLRQLNDLMVIILLVTAAGVAGGALYESCGAIASIKRLRKSS